MPSAERVSQPPIAPPPVEVGDRLQPRPVSHAQNVPRRRSSPRFDRLALMVLLGILGLGLLGFLASRTFAWLGNVFDPGPQLEGDQLDIGISQPPIALPSSPAAIDPTAPLTTESAQQIIETWLTAKSAAMGENHDRDRLATVLADPALSQWQKNVDDAERDSQYYTYEHQVKVTGVDADANNPDAATIDADVTEAATLYENGQPSSDGSRNDRLQIRYDVIRQDGQWRIKAWTVQ